MTSTTKVNPTARRSQGERREATKALLCEATIDLLVARGWSALSITEVCRRAGLTAGAYHHHFSALPELVAEALDRLHSSMVTPGRPPATDLVGLLDRTWEAASKPRFKAVIEAWLAVADDPALGEALEPVIAEFAKAVRPELLAPEVIADEARRVCFLASREAMFGLALGRATNGGKPLAHEASVIEGLRTWAQSLE